MHEEAHVAHLCCWEHVLGLLAAADGSVGAAACLCVDKLVSELFCQMGKCMSRCCCDRNQVRAELHVDASRQTAGLNQP